MKDIENSKKESPMLGLQGMGGGVGGFNFLSAGGLFFDLRLFSFGLNQDPQGGLGQNTTSSPSSAPTAKFSSPKQVGSDAVWTNIGGAGEKAVTAIKNDGTLWAWGDNERGSLGLNQSGGNQYNRSSPTQVGTDTDWMTTVLNYGPGGTASAAEMVAHHASDSNQHQAFAIKQNGTLWSWGANDEGGLGLNQQGNPYPSVKYSSPTQIGTSSNWTNVYCDRTRHVAATKNDGTLWTWGMNEYGSLGVGDGDKRSSPTQVPGTGWKKAEMGGNAAMIGLKYNGELYCWGRNEFGQLGQNQGSSDLGQSNAPLQVPGTDWVDCAQSSSAMIAIKSDGSMWSWGSNHSGTLGQNQTAGEGVKYSSPTQIGTNTNWTQCWSNYQSCFANTGPGQMHSWGNNEYGQLGQNSTSTKKQPESCSSPGAGVVDVDGGVYSSFWLRK